MLKLCTSKNNSCPEVGDAGASAIESISQASKQSRRPEPVSSRLRILTVHGDMSVCVIYSNFCLMVKVMHHCEEAMRGREALSSILTDSTCVSVQHTNVKPLNELVRIHFIMPVTELQLHCYSCGLRLVTPVNIRQRSLLTQSCKMNSKAQHIMTVIRSLMS